MYDLFYQRMNSKGTTIGEAMKKQSDTIMKKNFLNDLRTRKVHVVNTLKAIDVWTYAKYQSNSSIPKDQIDYRLQFKPGEHYPIGCYVEIPDENGDYRTWLLVGKDDYPQFTRYSVLQCNWTFHWIFNNKVYSSPGVLRTRNSHDSGVWDDGFMTVIENQNSFWVPTNKETQTICYNTRFLLSENQMHPSSYTVIKIEDTFPCGIIKVTLKQDLYNPETDNPDLMIADYYKSSIVPNKDDAAASNYHAKIECNGKTPKVIIGGSYKKLTGIFYDGNGFPINKYCQWNISFPDDKAKSFHIMKDNNILKIKALEDYTLIGKTVEITLTDNLNQCKASIQLEVCAR